MPSLTSLNLHCRIIAFSLVIHYFTPWPWPLTFHLEHLQRIVCDVIKLCTKFERNRTICGWVIAISVFEPYDLEHVKSVALGSRIMFTKFDLRQLTPAWIIAFFDADTLCHAVTLTFDPLTLKVRGISSVTWSKSHEIWRFGAFSRAILWGGSELTELSQGCVDSIHQTWPGHGRSSQHYTFVSEFGYFAAFSNAGGSKLSDVLNDAKFCTFDLPL